MENSSIPFDGDDLLSSTQTSLYHQQQQSEQIRHLGEGIMDGAVETSHVELYAVVVLLLTFVVVGSTGNAIVLWVFCRRHDQLVSTVFIVVLAGVDFVTCLVVVPFTVVFEMVEFHVFSNVACKLYQVCI